MSSLGGDPLSNDTLTSQSSAVRPTCQLKHDKVTGGSNLDSYGQHMATEYFLWCPFSKLLWLKISLECIIGHTT